MIAIRSAIDREIDDNFSFRLSAIDAGSPAQSSSASVTVTVADENDNSPTFTQTYYNDAVSHQSINDRSDDIILLFTILLYFNVM